MQHPLYAPAKPKLLSKASAALLDADVPDYVYVIVSACDLNGPVKIGRALDPISRCASLQTGNPHKLNLLDVIPGSRSSEFAIHCDLRRDRIRGEWFGGERTQKMVQTIRAAAVESVLFHREHGIVPSDHEVLDAMGLQALDGPDTDFQREFRASLPVDPEPEPRWEPDPNYIVVGETAGPPPTQGGGYRLGRNTRRGRRGGMK